jgi:hypothetical protein
MTTRKPKPKPDYSPDRPTEQLQLVPVTIEHKLPARAAQPWLDAELWPGSLPQGKIQHATGAAELDHFGAVLTQLADRGAHLLGTIRHRRRWH